MNLGCLGVIFRVLKVFVKPFFSRWLYFDADFLQRFGIMMTVLKD